MSFPNPNDYMTYKKANSSSPAGGNGSGCLKFVIGLLILLLIVKACS